MFCNKKTVTREESDGDPKPIDFDWVFLMGTARFGLTYEQTGRMYFGKWLDFFEIYKNIHNFEIKRQLFQTENRQEPEETPGSIMDL